MSSAPRGLAPREGLDSVLMKMGHAGPPFKPRRRPQASKSGDPRSQNADKFIAIAFFMTYTYSSDYEIMQQPDTEGIPCVLSNVTT